MKIFMTGATGVLGKRVASHLIAEGHEVKALCRSVQNYQDLEKAGVKPVWGNIYDPEQLQKITMGEEAIIHLASNVPVNSQKLKREDWFENDLLRERGTENLAQAGVRNGVKLFVAPGLMLAYGDQKGKWVSEKSPLSSKVPPDIQSAIRMEEIVQRYVRKQGLPAVVLRLGILYAEDSAHTLDLINQLQNGTAAIVGKGDAFLNLVHADDAAKAIASVVKRYSIHVGAVYNISDGNPVTTKDYVDFLAEKIGVKEVKARNFLSAWINLSNNQLKVAQLSFRAKNEQAAQKLKWAPTFGDYKEGLTHVVANLFGKLTKNAA